MAHTGVAKPRPGIGPEAIVRLKAASSRNHFDPATIRTNACIQFARMWIALPWGVTLPFKMAGRVAERLIDSPIDFITSECPTAK